MKKGFLSVVMLLLAGLPWDSRAQEIITFADNLVPTWEIHVAPPPLGDDAAGDGSSYFPYATISHALGLAGPGCAVKIHPGTYGGGIYMDRLEGEANAPIWIGGADPDHPPHIFQGPTGIQVSRGKYLILHDLEVSGSAYNGINFDDGGEVANPGAAHHILFKTLHIHDIGGSGNQDGLKLSGINEFFVLFCRFARCGGGGSGLDHVGCHNGVIAWSQFEDLGANAIQVKGGSSHIRIQWNRITNAGERGINMGGSTGFAYFRPPLPHAGGSVESKNILVFSNLFEGSATPVAFVGTVNSRVEHNTLVNPDRWLMRILQETTTLNGIDFLPCSSNTFAGNLVYYDYSRLRTHLNIGSNTAPETFVFSSNLWYAHDDPSRSRPFLPAAETSGVYGQDPELAWPGQGDYRINNQSPARGLGPTPAPVFRDYRGLAYENPPAAGAFEAPGTCPADLDRNGVLDQADLALFSGEMGRTRRPVYSLDPDLDLDGKDIALFARHMAGTGCID